MNPVRASLFASGSPRKQGKSKIRGQPQIQNENTQSEELDKKSQEIQEYAGISADLIRIYAEQSECQEPSDEVCDLLARDINFKLRYIIHDCMVKSHLNGRESITSTDVEETFATLNIDKVYGAPSLPNWIPFKDQQDNTLYYLDDRPINLIEIAEEDINLSQEGTIVLDRVWLPKDDIEDNKETYAEYFEIICDAVVSDDPALRRAALLDISTNPSIGPITDWFYRFVYFLLIKDVKYDHITMRALKLLEVLENSPLPSMNVYGKLLKLLVRLLLERLLTAAPKQKIVKYMSYVLSLLCLRSPLKDMVLSKLEHKMVLACDSVPVTLLNIIYNLGVDAVKRLFIPNTDYIMSRVVGEQMRSKSEESEIITIVLAIYGMICKANLMESFIYESFHLPFGMLVPYYTPKTHGAYIGPSSDVRETIKIASKLIKTRRKMEYRSKTQAYQVRLEDMFDINHLIFKPEMEVQYDPTICDGPRFKLNRIDAASKVQRFLDTQRRSSAKRDTVVVVGKISLLLPILKQEAVTKCVDHSFFRSWM